MHDTFQIVGFVSIFLTVIVGILFNDKRFDRMDSRFDRTDSRMDRMQADLSSFMAESARHDIRLEMLEKKQS